MYSLVPTGKGGDGNGYDYSVFGWFNTTFAVATLLSKTIEEVRAMSLEIVTITDVYNKVNQMAKQ